MMITLSQYRPLPKGLSVGPRLPCLCQVKHNSQARISSVACASSRPSTYTVKRGDSLTSISEQHGVTVRSLKEANQQELYRRDKRDVRRGRRALVRSDIIYPGQKLAIPPRDHSIPLRRFVTGMWRAIDPLPREVFNRLPLPADQKAVLKARVKAFLENRYHRVVPATHSGSGPVPRPAVARSGLLVATPGFAAAAVFLFFVSAAAALYVTASRFLTVAAADNNVFEAGDALQSGVLPPVIYSLSQAVARIEKIFTQFVALLKAAMGQTESFTTGAPDSALAAVADTGVAHASLTSTAVREGAAASPTAAESASTFSGVSSTDSAPPFSTAAIPNESALTSAPPPVPALPLSSSPFPATELVTSSATDATSALDDTDAAAETPSSPLPTDAEESGKNEEEPEVVETVAASYVEVDQRVADVSTLGESKASSFVVISPFDESYLVEAAAAASDVPDNQEPVAVAAPLSEAPVEPITALEAQVSEAPVEAGVAEAEVLEATVEEALIPEIQAPEPPVEAALVSEVQVPEASVETAPVSEAQIPETSIEEAPVSEADVPEAVEKAPVLEVQGPETTIETVAEPQALEPPVKAAPISETQEVPEAIVEAAPVSEVRVPDASATTAPVPEIALSAAGGDAAPTPDNATVAVATAALPETLQDQNAAEAAEGNGSEWDSSTTVSVDKSASTEGSSDPTVIPQTPQSVSISNVEEDLAAAAAAVSRKAQQVLLSFEAQMAVAAAAATAASAVPDAASPLAAESPATPAPIQTPLRPDFRWTPGGDSSSPASSTGAAAASASAEEVHDLKRGILEEAARSQKGLAADAELRLRVERMACRLESGWPVAPDAKKVLRALHGSWRLAYTSSPEVAAALRGLQALPLVAAGDVRQVIDADAMISESSLTIDIHHGLPLPAALAAASPFPISLRAGGGMEVKMPGAIKVSVSSLGLDTRARSGDAEKRGVRMPVALPEIRSVSAAELLSATAASSGILTSQAVAARRDSGAREVSLHDFMANPGAAAAAATGEKVSLLVESGVGASSSQSAAAGSSMAIGAVGAGGHLRLQTSPSLRSHPVMIASGSGSGFSDASEFRIAGGGVAPAASGIVPPAAAADSSRSGEKETAAGRGSWLPSLKFGGSGSFSGFEVGKKTWSAGTEGVAPAAFPSAWMLTTFLDGDFRMSRTPNGGLFVMVRE